LARLDRWRAAALRLAPGRVGWQAALIALGVVIAGMLVLQVVGL
jgi:hypothetical protein